MINSENTPRTELHRLIGIRERAEKSISNGNPNKQKDYDEAEKDVKELLLQHPELEVEVETVEEHFIKLLYS